MGTVRTQLNTAICELEEFYQFNPTTLSKSLKQFFSSTPKNTKTGDYVLFEFMEVAGANEAEFEARSVEYACLKATNLSLQPPNYVIACGNGSIQMVNLDLEKANKFL